MNTTQAQQKALDDDFVAPADHLEFEKCNMRLNTYIKPKEATFQVVLDALALTSFYRAFLITADFCLKSGEKCLRPSNGKKTFSLSSDILGTLETSPISLIHEDTQVFGTILHELIQTSMLESKAYQTYYAFASGAKAPKPKLKSKAKVAKPDKKKQPAKRTKAKGSTVLSEVTLTEAEQIKLATKRSKKDFHVSHASGSGDGVDTQSKVPDEQQQKTSGTDEGTDTMPGVPDVPYIGIERSMKLKEEDDRCSSSSKYENSCDEDNMYLASKMKEAVDVAVQLQTNKLIEEAQAENQEFLSQVDSTMKDEDPSAGSDRGTKRRKSGKDVESSIDSRSKEKKLSMPQELRVRTEIMIEQPADKEVTKADWFKKLKRPPTPDPDWSKRRQIELSTLSGHGLDRHSTAQRALARVFTELEYTIFENVSPQAITERLDLDNPENKHLEYLKGGDSSRRYSTSVTKTKAATYELKWIEDLVQELFYGYASNLTSSKDVYSRRRIIAVTRLKIMKMYDYGHLEEIEVRRDDQKLYTFKEGYDKHLLSRGVDAEKIWGEVLLLEGYTRKGSLRILDKYNMTLSYFVSTHFSQNQRDLPRDIPLDSVVVLRYEKRSKSENKKSVPTEIELVQEQTQQGTSYEVSVSAEGVEELKRKVKIKGEKKEALLTLRQKPGQYICCQESQR
ncbi:hypothetical protein Tco_1555538 [Tanacetum coccineum]